MPTIRPSEAFTLLANETRMDILRELGQAKGDLDSGGLAYSELMTAIEVRDSGLFNYHLNQLLGHFVRREDERYSLSYEGVLIFRSVIAGTFSEDPAGETLPTESECHECGGSLTASPTDHVLFITCDNCDTTFLAGYLPPRAYADRTPAEVLSALDRRVRFQMGLIARAVCPWCYGTTAAKLVPAEQTSLRDRPIEVAVRHTCHQCNAHGWTTVGQRLLEHPDVIAFHTHHDVAITEVPLWELEFAVTDEFTTVEREDPCRATLSIPFGHDRFNATITEEARVETVTWVGRDDSDAEQNTER